MTDEKLDEGFRLKKQIENCKAFVDILMKIDPDRDQFANIAITGGADTGSASIKVCQYKAAFGALVSMMRSELDSLQREFKQL